MKPEPLAQWLAYLEQLHPQPIALGLDRAMGGIRVAPQHEFEGLDLHLHEEQAYIFDE